VNDMEIGETIARLEAEIQDLGQRVEDLHAFLSVRHAVEVRTRNYQPYAACSCGWTTDPMGSRGEAEVGALDHVKWALDNRAQDAA
jgi:hypothetical protein